MNFKTPFFFTSWISTLKILFPKLRPADLYLRDGSLILFFLLHWWRVVSQREKKAQANPWWGGCWLFVIWKPKNTKRRTSEWGWGGIDMARKLKRTESGTNWYQANEDLILNRLTFKKLRYEPRLEKMWSSKFFLTLLFFFIEHNISFAVSILTLSVFFGS